MTEYAQDFEVFQGDHRQITIPITDEAGLAKTITGSTQRWEAFDPATGVRAIQKSDTDISIVTVAPGTNNAIRFTLVPADTASLAAKEYDHEAEIADIGGNVSTVTRGKMTVRDDLVV